jgi:hypothetical protein
MQEYEIAAGARRHLAAVPALDDLPVDVDAAVGDAHPVRARDCDISDVAIGAVGLPLG